MEEIETPKEFSARLVRKSSVLGSVLVLFAMQMVLVYLVLLEVITDPPEEGVWQTMPNDTLLVVSKFVCGIVLHVFLSGELDQGYMLMKYSVNHPWKFDGLEYMVAWLAGFL